MWQQVTQNKFHYSQCSMLSPYLKNSIVCNCSKDITMVLYFSNNNMSTIIYLCMSGLNQKGDFYFL